MIDTLIIYFFVFRNLGKSGLKISSVGLGKVYVYDI